MNDEWEVIIKDANWLYDANKQHWMWTNFKLSLPPKTDYADHENAVYCLTGKQWQYWLAYHHYTLILGMNNVKNPYRGAN